jgi:hypothetical protein
MSSVEQVLARFVEDWKAGRRPQVEAYLDQVDDARRDELSELIATWMEVAPTPELDAAAVADIHEQPGVRAVIEALGGPAGLWPTMLPSLRERAGLTVRELAARVVGAVGLGSDAEERTAWWLGRMEHGELDPRRVTRRALDAIGRALGVDAAELERAGGLRPAVAANLLWRADEPVQATMGSHLDVLADALAAPAQAPLRDPSTADEVDRLFTGGPGG